MCGFSGIVADGDQQKHIEAMCRMLEHRGPEHTSVYRHENIWFGHNRLRIIDIETGDQPIFNEDGSVGVVYNGEIYNFMEIKADLEKQGHIFQTSSDTEVLVHLYEEKGLEMFNDLNGIFAFGIMDKKRNRVVLARDHFGVKPVFYYANNGNLIFGSEAKAILAHPSVPQKRNDHATHLLANLRYVESDQTLFKDIHHVPPGSYLLYEDEKIQINRYFEFDPSVQDMSFEEAEEGIRGRLKEAVRRQLVSDVPIGVYLSGGMDSSSLVAMMYEIGVEDIRTFTLGFNEPTDEFESAQMISDKFRTKHHTLSLDLDPMKNFPNVIWHAEVPKINLLQGYMMSQFVSKHVKVVLGGLGGDELFAGYDIHGIFHSLRTLSARIPKSLEKVIGTPLGNVLSGIQRKTGIMKWDEYRRGLQTVLASGNVLRQLLILRNVWDHEESVLKQIYTEEFRQKELPKVESEFSDLANSFSDQSAMDQVFGIEFQTKMVNDYLWTEDRMSMSHSVEERVPFLDRDLVDFAFSIPAGLKMKGGRKKSLLRSSMSPLLPKEIIEKKKWGFAVNPYLQFQKDLKVTVEKVLTKEFVDDQGIFNYAYIRSILDYNPSPKLRWHYNFLWILTGLAIWEKMFIHSDAFLQKDHPLEAYCN